MKIQIVEAAEAQIRRLQPQPKRRAAGFSGAEWSAFDGTATPSEGAELFFSLTCKTSGTPPSPEELLRPVCGARMLVCSRNCMEL